MTAGKISKGVISLLGALTLVAGWLAVASTSAQGATETSWQHDWASPEGIALERVAVGFTLPTALVVADTSAGPRYVVTELGGAIKTVSPAGEVETFATVDVEPQDGSEGFSETGLAGICLDPDAGYLFVTYGRRDADGILRNRITRFELGPDGVAAPPVAEEDITGKVSDFRAAHSHQIGGCRARDGNLYVSVGDGWNVAASGDPEMLLGKVLRLDYDGGPAVGNPLGDDPEEYPSYVWAYGFRNPWGIEMIGDDVYVAHNGHELDALVKVAAGEDHLWAGSDDTITVNALNVWNPAIGPTQLSYAGSRVSALGPDWNTGFFVGSSTENFANGISFVPYDPDLGRVTGPQRWVIKHIDSPDKAPADREQIIAAVAVAPDGLMFAGMLPGSDGETGLFRLTVDLENQLPNRIASASSVAGRLDEYGCLACHQYEGTGGHIGPNLDPAQLEERLETVLLSDEYEASAREIDNLDESPWTDYADARDEVLAAQGKDRLLVWVKYRIMEPRFDRIDSEMPTLGIPEDEAETLAEMLITNRLPWWRQQAISIFGSRESANWFLLGAVSATVLVTVLFTALMLWRRRRRRTTS